MSNMCECYLFGGHYFLSFTIIEKLCACVVVLTFLAVLSLEPKSTQTSISLVCKTGLTNPVVLTLSPVLPTSVL